MLWSAAPTKRSTFPLLSLGLLVLAAFSSGATHLEGTNWAKTAKEIALVAGVTFPFAILTEDGFFRGWLWGELRRAGFGPRSVVLLTSLFFGLWHTPLVFFAPPFRLPWPASAIYVVGAMLGGVVFGLLRQLSGSIVPVAFCHALWNGFGYALFGAGKERGALGLEPFSIFHAETGAVALAVNAVFAALLYSYVFGSYVFGEPQGDAAPPRVDRETEPRNTPS